jgi:hypothetical protein
MSKIARSDEPEVNQVQMKSKAQMEIFIRKLGSTLSHFDIHLTFACLREAASAKAGVLAFGIRFFKVSLMRIWLFFPFLKVFLRVPFS